MVQLYGRDAPSQANSAPTQNATEEQLPIANAVEVIQDIWTNGLRAMDHVGNNDGRITNADNQTFYPAEVQQMLARTDVDIAAFRAGVQGPLTRVISQFDRDGIPGLNTTETQQVLTALGTAAQQPVTAEGTITTQVMIDTRIGAVTAPEAPGTTPPVPGSGPVNQR